MQCSAVIGLIAPIKRFDEDLMMLMISGQVSHPSKHSSLERNNICCSVDIVMIRVLSLCIYLEVGRVHWKTWTSKRIPLFGA